MGFLEKWRPRELERFRGEMDQLLERFGFHRDWWPKFDRDFFPLTSTMRPAIESCVKDNNYIVRTDLPGVDPKDVEIKVVGGVLTIKGSREENSETKKADFMRREIRYGSFERSISLPEGIKAEDLKASYHDGVLEISAPMPKEAAPKEVKIQVAIPKVAGEKSAA